MSLETILLFFLSYSPELQQAQQIILISKLLFIFFKEQ